MRTSANRGVDLQALVAIGGRAGEHGNADGDREQKVSSAPNHRQFLVPTSKPPDRFVDAVVSGLTDHPYPSW